MRFELFRPDLGLRRGLKQSKILILAVRPITLGRGREQSKYFEIDTPSVLYDCARKTFHKRDFGGPIIKCLFYQACVVLVTNKIRLLALLVGSPEELPTAEADDAPVVPDVHVTHLGLILTHKTGCQVKTVFRVSRQVSVGQIQCHFLARCFFFTLCKMYFFHFYAKSFLFSLFRQNGFQFFVVFNFLFFR